MKAMTVSVFGRSEPVRSIWMADTWWTRFRGYMGRVRPEEDTGLLLKNCGRIHTYWMLFNLDIAYLDAEFTVLAIERDLHPARMGIRVSDARHVLEVPSGGWLLSLKPGDRLDIQVRK